MTTISDPEINSRQRRVTAGVMLITFLVALESTVVSTAMPKIVKDVGGLALYSWVFSGYLTAVTLTGPAWGKLADRIGSKRTYLSCALLFLLGSLAAAQATTMNHLIAARILQGLGGGGITPLGQVILAENHDIQSRARLQGLLVSVYGIASIAGPPLGGYLATYDWRFVFWLNLPFGLAGAFAVLLFLPHAPPSTVRAFDRAGFVLFLAAYSALLIACQSLQGGGGAWEPWLASAILVGLLLSYEVKQPDPFFPIHLRSYPVFGLCLLVAPMIGVGVFGGISYLPLYLQAVLGQSAMQAGRSMLPLLLAWTASAAVAARLYLRIGTRPCLLLASLCLLTAFSLLFGLPQNPWTLALAECCIGLGGGLSFSPMTLAVQQEVPRESLGTATSAIVFLRMLGASLGTSLMGAFLPADKAGDLSGGLQKAFVVGLVCSTLALLAVFRLARSSSQTNHS